MAGGSVRTFPKRETVALVLCQESPPRRRWNQVHWVMKSDLAAAKQKGATRVTW